MLATVVVPLSFPARAQQWIQFTSRADMFGVNFADDPKVQEITPKGAPAPGLFSGGGASLDAAFGAGETEGASAGGEAMRQLLTGLTILALNACGGSSPTAPAPLPDPSLAPTRVVLAGKSLALDASLWRDFMPISPPDGKPLVAVLQIRTEDGSEVPATVRADMVWVLNGRDTWTTVPREERSRSETTPVYELVAREGPKWGPGITVDVVVRLHDINGFESLLRVANRPIQGTF